MAKDKVAGMVSVRLMIGLMAVYYFRHENVIFDFYEWLFSPNLANH